MIVDWPSDLPTIVITDNYAERPPNSIRRTTMDAGPPKRRRRGSSMTRPFTLLVPCAHWETERMDRFYFEDLEEGTLLFRRPHPRLDGVPMLDSTGRRPILTADGRPILVTRNIIAAFTEPPSYAPDGSGMTWLATCPIEVYR